MHVNTAPPPTFSKHPFSNDIGSRKNSLGIYRGDLMAMTIQHFSKCRPASLQQIGGGFISKPKNLAINKATSFAQ